MELGLLFDIIMLCCDKQESPPEALSKKPSIDFKTPTTIVNIAHVLKETVCTNHRTLR